MYENNISDLSTNSGCAIAGTTAVASSTFLSLNFNSLIAILYYLVFCFSLLLLYKVFSKGRISAWLNFVTFVNKPPKSMYFRQFSLSTCFYISKVNYIFW